MGWIDVNEQKPPLNESVLLLVDGEIMIEGTYENSKYSEYSFASLHIHGCGCCSGDDDVVTHWMPRPELPIK